MEDRFRYQVNSCVRASGHELLRQVKERWSYCTGGREEGVARRTHNTTHPGGSSHVRVALLPVHKIPVDLDLIVAARMLAMVEQHHKTEGRARPPHRVCM